MPTFSELISSFAASHADHDLGGEVQESNSGYRTEGHILIASNQDKPGAVAKLSNLLGTWGINIAGMALGRAEKGGQALFTLTLDDHLTPEQLQAIRALDVIDSAYLVKV